MNIATWWNTLDSHERRTIKFKARVEAHSSTPWGVLSESDRARLLTFKEMEEMNPIDRLVLIIERVTQGQNGTQRL